MTNPRLRVAHIITRLILGGAQENTLLTVEDQGRLFDDDVILITGPAEGPEGSLIERARRNGVDLRLVDSLRRSVHPVRDWQCYRELVRLLREWQPQLVHTHSSKGGIVGRAAAAKLNIPCVHTVHGSPFHPYQSKREYWTYRTAERWAGRRCDRIISVCDAMTDQYVEAGIAPREKFVTVYSGMEVGPFLDPPVPRDTVRQKYGFDPQHIVVGKVARLFELKGHEFILAAAKTVLKQNPEVRFLWVGDGILRAALQQQIDEAGLTHAFVFTGLVPPEQVAELIGAMDIVVHTSLREGLARVLPQGLIAGKPVISYDIDGAREVVLPGRTGYLLPPQSVEPLTAAILELATHPELRARLGATGRAMFTEQFRHETMTTRLREIYREVLDRRGGVHGPT